MHSHKSIFVVSIVSLAFAVAAAQAVDEHHPEQTGAAPKGAPTAPDKNAPAKTGGEMPKGPMMENMQKMHAQMAQIHKTKDPKERERLMQEHMKLMQDNMKTMGNMMGSGGTMGSGMGAGAGMPADKRLQMMEQRMDMMQQMMDQMLQQQETMMRTKPAK